MSGPKFTPGPWIAAQYEQGRERIATVATIGDWIVGPERPDYDDHGSAEHDARLIAAAPTLYDLAHQYASECGECAGVGIKPDDEPCDECAFIRVILDEIDVGIVS